MLEPEDVPGWGAFLQGLGELREHLPPDTPGFLQSILDHLEQVSQQIILQEMASPRVAQELLTQGMNLLLQWSRDGHLRVADQELRSYQARAQQLGLAEPASPAPPPGPSSPASSVELAADPELVQNFITEAGDYLSDIETEMVYLEQDSGNPERLNAVFRSFHSIKGVAGFLNLAQIHDLAHDLETLLDEARSGRLKIGAAIIDCILSAVDLLKEMLADLQGQLESGQPGRVFDCTSCRETIKNFLTAAPDDAGPATPASRPLGEILVAQGAVSAAEVEEALSRQRQLRQTSDLGEILIAEGKAAPSQVAQALVHQMRQRTPAREAAVSPAIKVDVQKLDYLVDMMGELMIVQSQVQQHPQLHTLQDQKLVRTFAQMARITSELQRISMSLRMIPIGQTFQKMVRLVRDLARKSEKPVELHLEGEDTEIDRNMVEAVYDPLVHMVRNAIDHGLETAGERESQGKPGKGNLWLRAYHKGGNVVIEIEDDGQGLNRERILAKARQQGLVADGEALNPAQIDHLIFKPGFSTAAQVTAVSGRGVGMDVVKKAIDELRGKIEIASQPGQGTRFTIRLPLTLAIIDGLIVQVGSERYILPAVAVRQTVRPVPEDYCTVQGQGELIRVRDKYLPLVRLHQLFQIVPRYRQPTEALVLVVENDGEHRGVMVDDIIGKQEVVIKSLGQVFHQIKGVSSGTILGDGRVGLILDLGGLFAIS